MMTIRGHLVVRADGTMRVVKLRPHLRFDEVAFPLTVQIPRTWGQIYKAIEVELPEPPESSLVLGDRQEPAGVGP